jgi:hypothetical protein
MTDPLGSGRRDRFLAWLVTGAVGRGMSFEIDFSAALRGALARRRR